jgi:hypothetical protein
VTLDFAIEGDRNVDLHSMFIGAGADPTFRQPISERRNLFPDPSLSGIGAVQFDADLVSQGGENTIQMRAPVGSTFVRYHLEAVGAFAPGRYIEFEADILAAVVDTGHLTLRFYEASGSELNLKRVDVDASVAGAWHALRAQSIIPATAAIVELRLTRDAGAEAIAFENLTLVSDAPLTSRPAVLNQRRKTIYFDPTGSDTTGQGTQATPFASLTRAMQAGFPSARLRGGDGDYLENPKITGWDHLEIECEAGGTIRLIGGTRLEGFTQVPGTTKVYQAACPDAPIHRIWERGTPDPRTAIPASEQHELQGGASHRLDAFQIVKIGTPPTVADAVAAIEAAPNGTHHWEDGQVYISTSDGAAPGARDFYVPDANNTNLDGGTGVEKVTLRRVTAMFGRFGLDVSNTAHYELTDCAAQFTRFDGIRFNDAFGTMLNIAIHGADNDGLNTRSLALLGTTSIGTTIHNIWITDCADDAGSQHQKSFMRIFNGLFEYNWDRGIVCANGGHGCVDGFICRFNGLDPFGLLAATPDKYNGGAGMCVAGQPLANDGGLGTIMTLRNGHSHGNQINHQTNGVGNKLDEFNCVTGNAVEVGRDALDGGLLNAVLAKTYGETVTRIDGGAADGKPDGTINLNPVSDLV